MPTWKKALVVDAGAVIAITISLFTVPAQTPFWLWAVIAVASLIVLNYVFFISATGGATRSSRKSKWGQHCSDLALASRC